MVIVYMPKKSKKVNPVRNTTVMLRDDLEIRKWLDNQSNVSASMKFIIRKIIATYGLDDVIKTVADMPIEGELINKIPNKEIKVSHPTNVVNSKTSKRPIRRNTDKQLRSSKKQEPQPKVDSRNVATDSQLDVPDDYPEYPVSPPKRGIGMEKPDLNAEIPKQESGDRPNKNTDVKAFNNENSKTFANLLDEASWDENM